MCAVWLHTCVWLAHVCVVGTYVHEVAKGLLVQVSKLSCSTVKVCQFSVAEYLKFVGRITKGKYC